MYLSAGLAQSQTDVWLGKIEKCLQDNEEKKKIIHIPEKHVSEKCWTKGVNMIDLHKPHDMLVKGRMYVIELSESVTTDCFLFFSYTKT